MNRPIDLRSDTVTKPTAAMRRAIAEAEVGDDVFMEDPTVRRLEETVAGILGMEAALFCASGTMANQIAVAVHTRPGDEVLLEAESHLFLYEGGGPAVISGAQVRVLPGNRGLVEADTLRRAIRPKNVHFSPSTLLVLENTHNRSGGRVLPLDGLRATAVAGREAGLAIHLDGARIWNASIASGVPEATYAALCDSVGCCLSKGLGAPVGSLICGSRDFVDRARFVRKRIGGGMRQAGILAAAGLHAIEHHRQRLSEDHRRAHRLAVALSSFDELSIDPDEVETNILRIDVRVATPDRWCAAAERRGLRIVPFGATAIRAVLHLDVDDADLNDAIVAFGECARELRAG